MQTYYTKWYSPSIGKEMEIKVYGHAGRPVLFIPCQDGHFNDFEGFHMTDTWAPWIESGQVMVFSIDTIDAETWSNASGDPYWRIRRYEQWIRYIVDELAPFIRERANARNGWDGFPPWSPGRLLVTGAAAGGFPNMPQTLASAQPCWCVWCLT